MFSSILKEHQQELSCLKSEAGQARKNASKDAEQLTKIIHDSIQERVVQVSKRQDVIDKEIAQISNAADHFVRQTGSWASQAEKLHDAAKSLGDVENWAASIQWDIQAILRVLNNIKEKHGR
ncbi:hypothetical protein P9112_004349 [Eukaryota sp. TZLM1-RC]